MRRMAKPDDEVMRRIEQMESRGPCRSARILAELFPDLDLVHRDVAGGCVLILGRGYPVNKVAGLGLVAPVDGDVLSEIEALFDAAGLPTHIDVAPNADPSLERLLVDRGYEPAVTLRLSAVDPRVVASLGEPRRAPVAVERVTTATADAYERTVARGFQNMDDGEPGLPARVFARVATRLSACQAFLAFVDGEPAGGGAVVVRDRTAAFFGASTRPRFRGRGVQSALLRRRIAVAKEAGCDLAFVKTDRDSGSERNVRRAGFKAAYEKTTWQRSA
jgi:GNAT superfamily N-acetyltransferase